MYKLQLKPQQGSNVSILTSVPARCLASTSCTEQLEVHLTDSGGILAMNYDFAACPCSPEQRVSDTVPSSWSFKEVVPALVRRSRKIAPLTLLPRTEGTPLFPQAGLPSASLGKGRASAMALTAAHLHKNGNIQAAVMAFWSTCCRPSALTNMSTWQSKAQQRLPAPLQTSRCCAGVDGKSNRPGVQQAQPVVDPATGEVKEPPKDERSFLQKNWMLILPAAFLVSCGAPPLFNRLPARLLRP